MAVLVDHGFTVSLLSVSISTAIRERAPRRTVVAIGVAVAAALACRDAKLERGNTDTGAAHPESSDSGEPAEVARRAALREQRARRRRNKAERRKAAAEGADGATGVTPQQLTASTVAVSPASAAGGSVDVACPEPAHAEDFAETEAASGSGEQLASAGAATACGELADGSGAADVVMAESGASSSASADSAAKRARSAAPPLHDAAELDLSPRTLELRRHLAQAEARLEELKAQGAPAGRMQLVFGNVNNLRKQLLGKLSRKLDADGVQWR